MGCSCSKPKPKPAPTGQSQSFTLNTGNGYTQTFGSKLEAQAAQTRLGGTIRES